MSTRVAVRSGVLAYALSVSACGNSLAVESAFDSGFGYDAGHADGTTHKHDAAQTLGSKDGSLGGSSCVGKTCATLAATCGAQGDGCGNLIQCGTCPSSTTCGGGGKPNECGVGGAPGVDGGGGCTPKTCATAHASCGPIGDGCGGVVQCGSCTAPTICGGGGVPYACGMAPDGGSCPPTTAACESASGIVCVDLQTDATNCGACGAVCGAGLACLAGACAPQCTGTPTCNTAAGQVCVGDHCANACDVVLTGTSSEGCEFWPVHLWNTEDGAGYFQGSFGVVASNTSTTATATVTLEDANGVIGTQTVLPGGAATFVVPNAQNRLTATGSGNAFHLRSNVPIAAYEYNPVNAAEALTGSAALLLPTHTLAESYFVVSYTYNAAVGTSPPQGQGLLAVIGTQPNTTVTVTVPVATAASSDGTIAAVGAGGTMHLTLRQGEVVEIAEAASLADITGATISANKPIAAFGGSGATTVPDTAPGGDHFEVQLIPTAAWGTSYECEKYTKRSAIDVDRWRIIGGVNGTTVTLSDPTIATVPTLAAGQVFEFATASSFDLTASEPVLVAHYLEAWGNLAGSAYDPGTFPRPTTNACPFAGSSSDAECLGDANMTLAVPTAQYLSAYTFYTPTSYAYDYVDVIAPVSASVLLDGAAIPPLLPIGSGTYGLAQIPVTSGVHAMSGDQPFGIMLYGYDYAVSYTCVGGLNLRAIGFSGPPGTCKPVSCAKQGFACGAAGDGCGGVIQCGTCVAPATCGGGGTPSQCGTGCAHESCAALGVQCGPAGDGCGGVVQCGNCVSPASCGGGGTPGVCGSQGGPH